MTDDHHVTDANQLPLRCFKLDLAHAARCSVRQIERLDRAGKLPDPLPIPGRPSWSRAAVIEWLSGGTSRRGRR